MATQKLRTPPLSPHDARARALDANALELLARVAAAGSFAQAARELALTRAAVSRRIEHIEAALGQPLFVRSPRALALTDLGRRLATRARDVFEATEAARLSLRARQGSGLAGTLRITAIPSLGQSVLAPALAGFQARHPALRIELTLTHRRIDLPREDVDLALRITREPPPDCVAVPLLPFAVRAYAAPGPRLESPAALAAARCLLLAPAGRQPGDAVTLDWRHETSAAPARVALQPAVVGDDLGTLLALARSGAGIAFAPDFSAAADVVAGALVDALPGWTLPIPEGDTVQALTLPAPARPAAAKALVDWLRERLRHGMPGLAAPSAAARPAR
jgi:DNA-binding transcriptional LysR family regulator